VIFYGLFRILFLLYVWSGVVQRKTYQDWSANLLMACMIAIVALNAEWLVLHVWRDSQFNFLFLIFVGMIVGYYTKDPVA
jgi:hypothetical protein